MRLLYTGPVRLLTRPLWGVGCQAGTSSKPPATAAASKVQPIRFAELHELNQQVIVRMEPTRQKFPTTDDEVRQSPPAARVSGGDAGGLTMRDVLIEVGSKAAAHLVERIPELFPVYDPIPIAKLINEAFHSDPDLLKRLESALKKGWEAVDS